MPNPPKNILFKEISQKVYRSAYIDGIVFILLGFVLIITAITINLHPIFMSMLIAVFLVCIPLHQALLSRFTYPRLGYFKVKTDDPKKLFPGIAVFSLIVIIGSLILWLIFTRDDPRRLYELANWYGFLPIVFGLIMFGPSLDLVDKTGQRIYYSLGTISTILGLGIVWLDFHDAKFGFSLYLILLGSISCIIGLILFLRFLRKYPIIPDDDYPDISEDNNDS